MRAKVSVVVFFLVFLLVLWLLWGATRSGYTRLELTEAGTGKKILSALLRDDEQVVLTWKNSLFGLDVTEVFQAKSGTLLLTQVTFADPRGSEPPNVKPEDVNDFYQTGEPFRAEGLSRPFTRILFRVGEIGNPKLKIGKELVELAQQVGFGGAVLLLARKPRFFSNPLKVFG